MNRFDRVRERGNRRWLVQGFVLAALALVFGGAWLAPAAAQQGAPDPAPDPRVAVLEQDFLRGMVPHHRGAMMMAEMAVQKSTRPEIKALAQSIIDSQQAEIALMTNYLRDWYGTIPPEGMMMPEDVMARMNMPVMEGLMPDMMAEMQRLEQASGTEFDVLFLQQMSHHHAMAVMMASPVLMAGHHQSLKMLASDIVIAQGQEIKQMQTWLATWYGVQQAGTVE
jgi:uncharacterized protein (DUF305 family)